MTRKKHGQTDPINWITEPISEIYRGNALKVLETLPADMKTALVEGRVFEKIAKGGDHFQDIIDGLDALVGLKTSSESTIAPEDVIKFTQKIMGHLLTDALRLSEGLNRADDYAATRDIPDAVKPSDRLKEVFARVDAAEMKPASTFNYSQLLGKVTNTFGGNRTRETVVEEVIQNNLP